MKHWKENENNYSAYINYNKGLIEEYKNKKKNYEAKIKELEKRLAELESK